MYRVTLRPAQGEAPAPVLVEVVPFVIGRLPDVDLQLDDETASGRHAQLEVQPDGRVVLRDLGSTNGTWVGGTRVTGGTWLSLPGTFRVGSTTLTVERVPDEVLPDRTVILAPVTAAAAPASATPPVVDDDAAVPAAPAESSPTPDGADARRTADPAPAWPPIPVASTPVAPTPIAPTPPQWAATPRHATPAPATPAAATSAPATASSAVMPQLLSRGLIELAIVAVIQALGGILVIVLAQSDRVAPEDAGTLLLLGAISLVAGAVQLTLVLFARRRIWLAAFFLVCLSIALAALAAWDCWTVINNDGNIALPALRLGLNAAGAFTIVKARAWFDAVRPARA